MQGGTGPDIWYNWGGTWSLQIAWNGCAVPNEAVLSPNDLKHVPAIAGHEMGRAHLGVPDRAAPLSDHLQQGAVQEGGDQHAAADVDAVPRGPAEAQGARTFSHWSRASRTASGREPGRRHRAAGPIGPDI